MNALAQIPELKELQARYADATPAELVEAMLRTEFPGQIALVSSFGAESAVLLHLAAQVDKAVPVIFLDTGKVFGETRRYRDQLIARLGLTDVRTVTPDAAALTDQDPKGVLWSQNANACCNVRKVEPLERALAPYRAWFTGRKAFQTSDRAKLPKVEFADGRFKINPLVGMSRQSLSDYFDAHDLPHHPLEADGYFSIGCMPCTDRVAPGEDPRAGRWRGQDKVECGIHVPKGAVA